MKTLMKSGIARAGLLIAASAGALAVSSAPAYARAISRTRLHGRGMTVALPGGGSPSAATVAIVVAALIAAVALAVVAWRLSRRRAEIPGSGTVADVRPTSEDAHAPSASKPLPARYAPALQRRRQAMWR